MSTPVLGKRASLSVDDMIERSTSRPITNYETNDRSTNWQELSREFDCRLNLNEDWEVKLLKERVKLILTQLSYVLIGGIEIGDNKATSDYEKKHVHIALRFKNRVSLSSVKNKLGFGVIGGQYYLTVRKQNQWMTYENWRNHHIKPETKLYPGEFILFEFGDLPKDKTKVVTKNMNKYQEIIELAKAQKWSEIETRYPLDYIRHAGQLRVKYWRQIDDVDELEHKQALWIYGQPGTGKSAVVHYLFGKGGKMYKKQLEDKWWDGFDILHHSCYYLEDMDPESMKKIGIQRMKVWSDHTGFAGDKKYGGLDIIRGQCIVTSNYHLNECIYNHVGMEHTLKALNRRFRVVDIQSFLTENRLELKSKEELSRLKAMKNADYSKCFTHFMNPTDFECEASQNSDTEDQGFIDEVERVEKEIIFNTP